MREKKDCGKGCSKLYQADPLKNLDEEIGSNDIKDLSIRATKEMAHAIGCFMASLVAAEGHLWLNLLGIKDRDRMFLLDAPHSPSGLFGNSVNFVVDRF